MLSIHSTLMKQIFGTALVFATLTCASVAADLNTARIDELTALKGKMNEKEGVYKVTFPRDDVKVVVDGWMMPPFMGLGTWAAFTKGAHIEAEGSVDKLASAVKKVYDTTKAIRGPNAKPAESFSAVGQPSLPEKNSINAAPLNEVFAMQGEAKDGMVKFTIGRPAKMHGVKIDNTMGVNTWAAFAGSDDNAVVDGDFAVTEDELQPVLKSLLKDKINIVAIHQHMTHEEPRIMFFHYWGRGSAKDLAQAVKGGLLVGGLLKVSSPIE